MKELPPLLVFLATAAVAAAVVSAAALRLLRRPTQGPARATTPCQWGRFASRAMARRRLVSRLEMPKLSYLKPNQMVCYQLQAELRARGLPTTGLLRDLVTRLEEGRGVMKSKSSAPRP